MAGAGFKTFAVGEVLTAENVNTYLMQQAVMVFADASARTAAIGTVTEGMVSYLSDTDSVEVYDGSSWIGVGLPLGTATPTDGQFLSYATATSTWDPVDAPIALGTATPTDGQILAFGTATSTWNPTDQLAGIGSNVVQTVKETSQTSSSTSWVDVTDFSVTITPTSSSSKVLVVASYQAGHQGNRGEFRVLKDGSVLTTRSSYVNTYSAGDMSNYPTFFYLDSPATTSAVTYKLQMRNISTGAVRFNAQSGYSVPSTSTFTAIEVAA